MSRTSARYCCPAPCYPAAVLVLLLLACSVPPASAQRAVTEDTPLRPVTRTFALTNARVLQAPGRVLDRATVVVRDGLIEAVGQNVSVPYDAEVIEADSLTVYAGFVDAFGYAGVSKPSDEDAPDIDNPDEPPRAVAGLMPERDVRDLLDNKQGRIGQLRELGFTAAQVAPHDGFLPGSAAVILLAGDTPSALVMQGGVAQVAQFDTAPNVYPATPMAILARISEVMQQARETADAGATYSEAPAGRGRVAYDPVLEALAPAARGQQPVVFVVEDSNEAFRALKLAEDAGFEIVLAGLSDAAPLADRLAAEARPLLLTLDLPDAIESEDGSDSEEAADSSDADASDADPAVTTPGGATFVAATRTFSYEGLDAETATLKQKRRAALARVERSAALLDSLGVPFAFALLDMKPNEVRANLRRVVAAGLSEDAALAALTTAPAAILGLDGMLGTVEPGLLANLVVTDGSYFDEDTRVRMVFVDGAKFEVEKEEPPEGADPNAVVVAVGTWDYDAEVPGSPTSGTFVLEGDADDLSGSITTPRLGTMPFESVTLEGNVLTMVFDAEGMGRITGTGVIDGTTFSGSLDVAGGDFTIPIEATRRPE